MALVSSTSQDTHELSNDWTETCDEVEDSEDGSEDDTGVLGGDRLSLTSNLGLLALFFIFLHKSHSF